MTRLSSRLLPLIAALVASTAIVPGTASAADAAQGLKPGQTFKDCDECQTMVVLPAGSFKMGSTLEERTREGVPATFADHEGPVRDITFARPFAIATTETTRGHFAQFVKETNRPIPTECAVYNPENDSWAGIEGSNFSWQNTGFAQTDDHPAACVSLVDGQDYAAWLSKKTGQSYRVPSEAEWEYAARAGTTTMRPWGDEVRSVCGRARIMNSATFAAIGAPESWMDELICASDQSWTAPVASYEPNAWGVYDMIGNLWEWVEDCAAPDHATLPADGSVQKGGDCNRRMTKGGAFHSRIWLARPATRGGGQPGTGRPVASGIRIVRDIQ